jgi:23S rRNA G2445 N2-methylase RlmL
MPKWIATCPAETRDVLVAELVGLGVGGIEPLHRGVVFEADLAAAYRAHLCLRTASRIQRVLAAVPASSVDELRAGLDGVAWSERLLVQRPFHVSAALTDDAARRLGEAPVADAVAASVVAAFGDRAPARRDEADGAASIVVFVRGGVATIGLDTAGRALHKRGWRVNGHPAVLKETLAASVLLLAGYRGDEPLYDPMCGSGTLVIEAAYLALGKAPLIHRGKGEFGFEHQAGFDRPLWRGVSDEARARRLLELPAPIFASDLRADFVDVARKGALRARVEKHLSFSVGPFQAASPPADHGLLVANLPYGERIGRGQVEALYAEIGATLRARYRGWRLALLVPESAPIGALRVRPDQTFALRNGALAVRLIVTGG